MKPTLLFAAIALAAAPLSAQQSEDDFQPGVNFLTSWDLDEDGTITLEELQERRRDIFTAFDENEDGSLSLDEFAAYDAARTDTMQRPDDRGQGGRGEQALSLRASDTDNDGAVSLEEFLAASGSWMELLDRNSDDVVSIDDFGMGQQGNGRARGQGRGPAQGQAMGQDQGMGIGQGYGQGKGQGMGRGQGQGYRDFSAQAGPGNGTSKNGSGRMAQDRQPMPGQGYGRSHGQQAGYGKQGGYRQGNIAFEAVPTPEGGLWIVDARTGDILLCKAVLDSNAPAGFNPVCREADL